MAKPNEIPMHQRREYKDGEMVNVGFRAPALLASAVHRAAEKDKAASTSKWLHHVVLAAAAKSLGVDPAELDPRTRPAPKPPTPEAAAQRAQLGALLLDIQDRLARLDATEAPVANRRR